MVVVTNTKPPLIFITVSMKCSVRLFRLLNICGRKAY